MTKYELRAGHCYELAVRYLLNEDKGILVHGTVIASNPRREMGHAWVEMGGQVYEPTEDELIDKSVFYDLYSARPSKRYSKVKAYIKVLKEGNYGPW